MRQARRASAVIWSTVVYAGAMLGTTACKSSGATPAPVASTPTPAPEPAPTPVEPEPVVVAEAKPPEPAPEPEPAPAPAPPAPITMQVVSKPSGAEVYLDDKLVGKTPLQMQVPRSDVPVTVRVTKKGYSEKLTQLRPADDLALEVVLVKPKARPRGVGDIGTIGHGSGSGTGKSTGRGFILS